MSVPPPVLPLVDLLTALGTRGDCRHEPDLHTGPDLFEAEPRADKLAREDVAKEVCRSCPVWALCLDYALRIGPTHGIWAGYRPRELAELRAAARDAPAADRPALPDAA